MKRIWKVNAYLPMTSHCSFCLADDGARLGVHWKIGAMRVRQSLMEKIWKDHDIKMAIHYAYSIRGSRDKIYNWRMIKSRFGETKVTYTVGGAPRYSDKQEAFQYAVRMYDSDIRAINEALHSGTEDPLALAKATKKQQQA